jgi:hypothetical protein
LVRIVSPLAHALTNNGQLHVATTRLLVHTSQARSAGMTR